MTNAIPPSGHGDDRVTDARVLGDVEATARRAVDGITTLARRFVRFSTRLAIGVTVVCIGSAVLGVAVLDGAARALWIVVAAVFATIGVGAAVLGRWRVGAVRRHVPELIAEVRSLVSSGSDASRAVVDTFVVADDGRPVTSADPTVEDGSGRTPRGAGGTDLVVLRGMHGVRGAVGSGLGHGARLTAAVTAVTTFPWLALLSILISVVFACFGALFLLALAF